jgi:hypothetical protein
MKACFVALLSLVGVVSCYWTSAPGTSFQRQLIGTIDLNVNAAVYDNDLFDAKDSDIIYI